MQVNIHLFCSSPFYKDKRVKSFNEHNSKSFNFTMYLSFHPRVPQLDLGSLADGNNKVFSTITLIDLNFWTWIIQHLIDSNNNFAIKCSDWCLSRVVLCFSSLDCAAVLIWVVILFYFPPVGALSIFLCFSSFSHITGSYAKAAHHILPFIVIPTRTYFMVITHWITLTTSKQDLECNLFGYTSLKKTEIYL